MADDGVRVQDLGGRVVHVDTDAQASFARGRQLVELSMTSPMTKRYALFVAPMQASLQETPHEHLSASRLL